MSEASFTPDTDEPVQAAEDGLPKISIFDLMVWMSFSALFLALFDSRELKGSVKHIHDAQQIAYGIVAGAQLAALLAVFRVRRKSNAAKRSSQQPGQWLLIVPVPWLMMLAFGVLGRLLTGDTTANAWSMGNNWMTWVYFLASVVAAIVWGFACKQTQSGWRVFYFLSVFAAILGCVTMLLFLSSSGPALMRAYKGISKASSILSIAQVVVLIWILIRERSIRSLRSWMHWVGVIGWLVFQLWGFLFGMLWKMFQP